MPKFLLIGLALLWTTLLGAHAQTTTVRGRVLDATDQSGLPGANVVLTQQPAGSGGTPLGTATDAEGRFVLTGVPAGTYQLAITFLGYQTQTQTVAVTNKPLDLAPVPLRAGGVQLKGVEVTGRAPAAVQKGDTAQYDSRAFKTNPDATAQDLITKMPGVTVDASGKVQAQGEQVQRVLVDGKEFFGNDPDAVLKNIPAEVIDKIQVYDRASDQSQFTGFDDGNQQKTINIITKPQFRNGQFGRAVAGYGPDEDGGRYRFSGNLNSFKNKRRFSVLALSNNVNEQNFGTEDLLGVVGNARQGGGGRGGRGGGPGGAGGGGGGNNSGDFLVNQNNGISRTHALGLNYSNTFGTKTEVQGSYFLNLSDNNLSSTTARAYTSEALRYREESGGSSRNVNNRFNLRVEHKFDSLNSLLWRPSLSVQRNTSRSTLAGRLFQDFTEASVPDSTQSTNSSDYRSAQTGINFANSLLYRHRFLKRGRSFALTLNGSYNHKNGSNYLTSRNTDFTADPAAESLTDQYARLNQTGWNWRADANYTEPLSEFGQLQLSAASSLAPTDSDKRTFNFDTSTGQYTSFNPELSNVFASRYLTQSGGLSYRFNNRTLQWGVGAEVQYASLRNQQEQPRTASIGRNFLNVLPNAMLRYNFSKQQNLRLMYRVRTNNPSINQLQEVVNNANPLQITIGNAGLRQEYQHNLFVRYSAAQPEASRSFFALLGGSYTDNYITNATRIVRQPTSLGGVVVPAGGQITQPVNLNQQYALRSAITYGLPIAALKSNLNLNATATYLQTPGLVNDQLNYNRTPAFGLGAALSRNISPELDFTLSSNSTQTYVRNSLGTQVSSRYFRQNTTLRLSWIVAKGITLKSDVNHVAYSGLSAGFNQQFVLWNASLGKKVFANQRGELQVYAFDLLGQNNSIQRNILPAYTEDVRTNILQRYVLLAFTYNLRSFGMGSRDAAPAPDQPGRGSRRGEFRGNSQPDGPGGPQ